MAVTIAVCDDDFTFLDKMTYELNSFIKIIVIKKLI